MEQREIRREKGGGQWETGHPTPNRPQSAATKRLIGQKSQSAQSAKPPIGQSARDGHWGPPNLPNRLHLDLPHGVTPRDPWLCCHTITTHGCVAIPSRPMAVLPYHHDPYDPWLCCHTITTHGRVAIPSRPMAVLPYHHDPWLCCHTITTYTCVAIPSRPMAVLPYRHDFRPHGPHGPPMGPLGPPCCRCGAALKGRLHLFRCGEGP